jgi:hypothetical protein
MYQLLTEMTPDRLTAVYEALDERFQRALDEPIGKALHSRPQTIARRPVSLRVKALRSFLVKQRDSDLASEMLRAYLLGARKELVTDFLDGSGVPHKEGVIEGEEEPDAKKVGTAVSKLLEAHDPADVVLYLEIAVLQWPENEALQEALEAQRETQGQPAS